MAINDINQQQMIPGAYITLIEKDSFPDTSVDQMSVTNAVYSSITLLQQGVIGVIGDISSSWTSLSALMSSTLGIPQCSFTANASKVYTYNKPFDNRVIIFLFFKKKLLYPTNHSINTFLEPYLLKSSLLMSCLSLHQKKAGRN